MVVCVGSGVVVISVVEEGAEDAVEVKLIVVEDAGDANAAGFKVGGVAGALAVAAAGVSSAAGKDCTGSADSSEVSSGAWGA